MAQGRITTIGRLKLCQAHAGIIPLPKITKMGFGTGGLDTDGHPIDVLGTETSLKNEVLRKELSGYELVSDTTCRYLALLEKTDLINTYINEQGLYDEEGDLIVYKTFVAKGKDDDEEFVFAMDEIF